MAIEVSIMELAVLKLFLGVAFVLAPLMTNIFFLEHSKNYSKAHAVALLILVAGQGFGLGVFSFVWPLFCAFGFLVYIRGQRLRLLSLTGMASCIPFVFSLISSIWFVAAVQDLHLLGYNRTWSFYASLHGSVLGWYFVGCFAYLSKKGAVSWIYLLGCYLSLFLFLSVAFGIDGVPHIKSVGVVGFSLFLPALVGIFTFTQSRRSQITLFFAWCSLFSISLSMFIAMLNEFWSEFPKLVSGIPTMAVTHGLMNTLVTVPSFYVAIRLAAESESRSVAEGNGVLFFDDICVLCSNTVMQLLRADLKRVLRYSSLKGQYAVKHLDSRHIESGASVVFLKGDKLFVRSEAVIEILDSLGGIYKLLSMFLSMLPRVVLNYGYDLVARNRYRFFGKLGACFVPTHETSGLFLP